MPLDRIGNGPKFKTKFERAQVAAKVQRLLCQGMPQYRIAKVIGVSPAQISHYKRKFLRRYALEERQAHEEAVAEECAVLREVYWMARRAYEASQEHRDKTEEHYAAPPFKPEKQKGKERPKPKGESLRLLKRVQVKFGRHPAAEYLAIMVRCRELIMRARGLFQDVNVNVAAVVAPGWEVQPDEGGGVVDVELPALPEPEAGDE